MNSNTKRKNCDLGCFRFSCIFVVTLQIILRYTWIPITDAHNFLYSFFNGYLKAIRARRIHTDGLRIQPFADSNLRNENCIFEEKNPSGWRQISVVMCWLKIYGRKPYLAGSPISNHFIPNTQLIWSTFEIRKSSTSSLT